MKKATLLFVAPLNKIEEVPAVIDRVAAYLGGRMLAQKQETNDLQLHLTEELNPADRSVLKQSLPTGIGIIEFTYDETPPDSSYLVMSV